MYQTSSGMSGIQEGIEFERGPATQALTYISDDDARAYFPISFPYAEWNTRAARYLEYWNWYNGVILYEELRKNDKNEPVYRFPLHINSVRNFSRKLAATLLGEEPFDTPKPLVSTDVSAVPNLETGMLDNQERNKLARMCENIVNLVWMESSGRSLQIRNAIHTQFLGGCYFKVFWDYWKGDRADRLIPISISAVSPDFVLPIWNPADYNELIEVFVSYKIPSEVARAEYGIEPQSGRPWCYYVEHWTKDYYSILVDGKPIVAKMEVNGQTITITMKNTPNVFGFVPFVYLPRVRDGGFYGPSIVDDIEGLVREYNARLADFGDAVRKSITRKRYVRNMSDQPREIQLGPGNWATDLGRDDPSANNPPHTWIEDPVDIPTTTGKLPENLWIQLLREANLTTVAFGEDEGSQRSALTLAFRMWPVTSFIRTQRSFWADGLNLLAKMILKIAVIKWKDVLKDRLECTIDLKMEDLRHVTINQRWLPPVPRDREQMVNEVVLLTQSNLISPRAAIERMGTVKDVDQELKDILDWQKQISAIQAEAQAMMKANEQATTGKEGVTTASNVKAVIAGPVASSGVKEFDK